MGLAVEVEMLEGHNRIFFSIIQFKQSDLGNHFSTGRYHPVSTNDELRRGCCKHLICAEGNVCFPQGRSWVGLMGTESHYLKVTCMYVSLVTGSYGTLCLVLSPF